MNKIEKLVIFDADGTLWNFSPIKNKRDHNIKETTLNKDLTPLLKWMKLKEIRIRVLSYQNHKNKIYSQKKIEKWLKNFKIYPYFEKIYIADKKENTKEKIIQKIIDKEKFKKKNIFLIGDRYKWDYLAAKNIGIKGILIDNPENEIYSIRKYKMSEIKKILK